MRQQRLLVVEDEPGLRATIETFLECEGFEVDAVSSTREALARLSEGTYPIVISDIYVDERTGLDVLQAARRGNPNCQVILMTGRGTMETVMQATREGAFDYIAKPFELDVMLETIRRAQAVLEAADDDSPWIDDLPQTEMVGNSRQMVEIYKTISKVAGTDATVLIAGETGTGKELIASMIHRNSKRADRPFQAVDCGSIPETLLESELFGAQKGAFTGADKDRIGIFEAANTGTVFLDEIGEIAPDFQVRLLRVLQENEIKPVGAPRAKKIDVRVICATNRSLPKMVEDGKFRLDLWYRINTVIIDLPPLRERRGDVRPLAQTFLVRYNSRYSQEARISDAGYKALESYTWPGNVRQLQHMVERLVILAPQGRIDDGAVREAIEAMEPRDHITESLADTEADQIKKVLAAMWPVKWHRC